MAVANYSPPAEALIKATRADFDRRDVVLPVHLVQYDDTLPVLAVALYKGGQPWTLPTGADVNLRMDKKRRALCLQPRAGREQRPQHSLYGRDCPDDDRLRHVRPSGRGAGGRWCGRYGRPAAGHRQEPGAGWMLESTDEYKTVQVLAAEVAANAKIVRDNEAGIQDVHENIEAIKAAPANATAAAASAKEARSWAVGDTASRPGEGMDNAKYYAALAQQVSQGAVGWYPNYEALYAAHDTGYDGNWAIIGDTDTIWVWDSDTGVWKDTGESSKFANYYDKTQIDANFYDKTKIDAKLPKPVTVTVAASAWTTGDYTVSWDDGSTSSYTTCATVTVAGVTADSRVAVSDRTRVTDAVRMVAALEPGAGVVKFYANSAPTSAAVFVLEVSQ